MSAPEILFERESVQGDSEQGSKAWEGTAETAKGSTGKAGGTAGGCLNPWDVQSKHIQSMDGVAGTLRANAGDNTQAVVQPTMIEMTSTKNTIVEDGVSPTLTARMGTGGNQVNAVLCTDIGFFESHEDKATTLLARQYKDPPIVYGISGRAAYDERVSPIRASSGDIGGGSENLCVQGSYQKTVGTLMASGYNKLETQEAANDMYGTGGPQIVRRLTPLECERLQGFPDGWTDIGDWVDGKGKKHKGESDSPRYKALGNSIAIPPWVYVLQRLSLACGPDHTMASLFDGIGGFPLIWETLHGKGPCIWASEIEEFPMAVTKRRFNG